jgi:hypothetical protein
MAEQSIDPIHELVCLIEGESIPFKVQIAANKQMFDLKKIICKEGVNVAPKDLSLLKVTTTQSPTETLTFPCFVGRHRS